MEWGPVAGQNMLPQDNTCTMNPAFPALAAAVFSLRRNASLRKPENIASPLPPVFFVPNNHRLSFRTGSPSCKI
jgi:hypothetical protein